MKTLLYNFLLISIILLTLQSCRVTIEGTVINEEEKGTNANVEIVTIKDGSSKIYELKANERGAFFRKVMPGKRYVINVLKEGYAFSSKIYNSHHEKVRFRLTKATVVTVNANAPIVVQDNQLNRVDGLDSASIQFSSALARIPFVYSAKGVLIDFKLPNALQSAYQAIAEGATATGTLVSVPANALINSKGQPVRGDVQVNLSTINLLSPDGMPGDLAVRMEDRIGYMVSYGAASVEIFQNGELLALNGKIKATIAIPIDATVFNRDDATAPDSIPFLTYLKGRGEWKQEGFARITPDRKSYTKEVTHFSVVNLDFVKADWSCVRIKTNIGSPFNLKVLVPNESPRDRTGITNPGACGSNINAHALLRLPPNKPIGVVLSNTSGVVANFVQYTGDFIPGTTVPVLPCGISTDPYNVCSPTDRIIELSESIPVEPLLIAKESLSTSAINIPANGIAFEYNSTANGVDPITLTCVFGGFDFTASAVTWKYVLQRMNNGDSLFNQVDSKDVLTANDILQEFNVPRDGFNESKFKVEVFRNDSLFSTSSEITINWL